MHLTSHHIPSIVETCGCKTGVCGVMHIGSPRRDPVQSQTQHLHPQQHVLLDLTCSRHHVCLSGPQQNDNICATSCEEMLESP